MLCPFCPSPLLSISCVYYWSLVHGPISPVSVTYLLRTVPWSHFIPCLSGPFSNQPFSPSHVSVTCLWSHFTPCLSAPFFQSPLFSIPCIWYWLLVPLHPVSSSSLLAITPFLHLLCLVLVLGNISSRMLPLFCPSPYLMSLSLVLDNISSRKLPLSFVR